MRYFCTLAPSLLAISLLPTNAAAQIADGDSDDAILVTANRAPAAAQQIGQSVTNIAIDAIAQGPSANLAEVLARTPGVQFRRNGGRGSTTSLFLRGADNGQTAILYDGVRLLDPSSTDSGGSLADISIGEIERVEILRGSQSTLYGSQAIGGVINIITAEPSAPFAATLQGEVGTRETHSVRGSAARKSDKLTWRVGGGIATTDGVSAFANGVERDGYDNHSFNGRLTYRPLDRLTIDLRSFYSYGDLEFDGFNADAANRGTTKTWLNRASLSFQLTEGFESSLSYGRTDIARLNVDEATPETPFTTFDATGSSDRIEYQGTVQLADGAFAVFGLDYGENANTISSFGGAPTSADDHTLGIYGQVTVSPLPGLSVTGGLRREDHSTFGGKTVPSASAAWTPNDGRTILRASYSEGFKAPSLYQLFSEFGNPALTPETARSWDIGAQHQLGEVLTLSATYYDRKTRNLVDFVSCSADPLNSLCDDGRFGFYDNIGTVSANGVELAASLEIGALSAGANYTLLDTENITPGSANGGNRLARRARDTFNANLTYSCDCGATFGARLSVVGDSFNDAGNSQRIAGHTLVDIHASYPITGNIEIYARVENLFDENYELVRDFSTLPRMAYAGARLTF